MASTLGWVLDKATPLVPVMTQLATVFFAKQIVTGGGARFLSGLLGQSLSGSRISLYNPTRNAMGLASGSLNGSSALSTSEGIFGGSALVGTARYTNMNSFFNNPTWRAKLEGQAHGLVPIGGRLTPGMIQTQLGVGVVESSDILRNLQKNNLLHNIETNNSYITAGITKEYGNLAGVSTPKSSWPAAQLLFPTNHSILFDRALRSNITGDKFGVHQIQGNTGLDQNSSQILYKELENAGYVVNGRVAADIGKDIPTPRNLRLALAQAARRNYVKSSTNLNTSANIGYQNGLPNDIGFQNQVGGFESTTSTTLGQNTDVFSGNTTLRPRMPTMLDRFRQTVTPSALAGVGALGATIGGGIYLQHLANEYQSSVQSIIGANDKLVSGYERLIEENAKNVRKASGASGASIGLTTGAVIGGQAFGFLGTLAGAAIGAGAGYLFGDNAGDAEAKKLRDKSLFQASLQDKHAERKLY